MLSIATKASTDWHVLIVDHLTVKTLSSVLRVSDLLADYNIALLEVQLQGVLPAHVDGFWTTHCNLSD